MKKIFRKIYDIIFAKKKFNCYEVWRPNIPDNGCKNQCKECKEIERNSDGESSSL